MFDDFGKLLLRVGIGVLLLFHGVDKAIHGINFIEGMIGARDLPSFVTYGVYLGEIIAPLLIIIGLFTKYAGLILAFNMFVAILLVHAGNIFTLGIHGEWSIETPLLFLIGGVAISLLGPGKYSLDKIFEEKNSR